MFRRVHPVIVSILLLSFGSIHSTSAQGLSDLYQHQTQQKDSIKSSLFERMLAPMRRALPNSCRQLWFTASYAEQFFVCQLKGEPVEFLIYDEHMNPNLNQFTKSYEKIGLAQSYPITFTVFPTNGGFRVTVKGMDNGIYECHIDDKDECYSKWYDRYSGWQKVQKTPNHFISLEQLIEKIESEVKSRIYYNQLVR